VQRRLPRSPTRGPEVQPWEIPPNEKVRAMKKTKPKQAKKVNIYNGGTVWAAWIDTCKSAGLPTPLREGPDLAAAKRLAKLVSGGEISESEMRGYLERFAKDDDAFLKRAGRNLRLLPQKLAAYRESDVIDDSECTKAWLAIPERDRLAIIRASTGEDQL